VDNADAHLKQRVMGREVVVAVANSRLDFGTWERIFYGEFDGRRRKRVLVQIIGGCLSTQQESPQTARSGSHSAADERTLVAQSTTPWRELCAARFSTLLRGPTPPRPARAAAPERRCPNSSWPTLPVLDLTDPSF
jgi:hypothetical protein